VFEILIECLLLGILGEKRGVGVGVSQVARPVCSDTCDPTRPDPNEATPELAKLRNYFDN
jgi:hypothetical protein